MATNKSGSKGVSRPHAASDIARGPRRGPRRKRRSKGRRGRRGKSGPRGSGRHSEGAGRGSSRGYGTSTGGASQSGGQTPATTSAPTTTSSPTYAAPSSYAPAPGGSTVRKAGRAVQYARGTGVIRKIAGQITKGEAGYVSNSLNVSSRCKRCGRFVSPGRCRLVEGNINPLGTCALFFTGHFERQR